MLLVHSTLHIGGAEEVSANICRRINRDEFDVHVCFLKERGVIADKIEDEGTVVHAVADEHRKRTDYMTWLKLRRLISREKFDVIHSHDVHSLIDGSLCRLTAPSLRHIHTFHFGNYPHRAEGVQKARTSRLARARPASDRFRPPAGWRSSVVRDSATSSADAMEWR